jgi:serine protease inhibitor
MEFVTWQGCFKEKTMFLLKNKKKAQAEEKSGMDAVVRGNTSFALELYRKLRVTDGNLFFSPFSISAALAMTYAGSHGVTQTQMANALHFPPDQNQLHRSFALLEARLKRVQEKGHIQLRTANAIWPRKGYKLLKTFLALTRKFYRVKITPVDFGDEEGARKTINGWVEENTEEKIKDLISPGALDGATRLVLVNAIYFKGDWAKQFDPGLTRELLFSTATDTQVQVPMMTRKDEFRYAEDEELQILELPYAGDDLSMLIFLPGKVDGLLKLEESLTVENLDKWSKILAVTEMEVFLPKFELTFTFRLDDTLKSMGMPDAFSDQADFSGMDGTRQLFIAAVLHKAFVAVNEQGTEAAAATAVIMMTKAVLISPIIFRADHPFLFAIRENSTGSILFIGRVVNPA